MYVLYICIDIYIYIGREGFGSLGFMVQGLWDSGFQANCKPLARRILVLPQLCSPNLSRWFCNLLSCTGYDIPSMGLSRTTGAPIDAPMLNPYYANPKRVPSVVGNPHMLDCILSVRGEMFLSVEPGVLV